MIQTTPTCHPDDASLASRRPPSPTHSSLARGIAPSEHPVADSSTYGKARTGRCSSARRTGKWLGVEIDLSVGTPGEYKASKPAADALVMLELGL
jgi:hypothetical protein